jgi:hypothetical protein
MDMSITPRLSEIDAERLRRARRTSGNPVLVAVTTAALAIDDARFGEAQNLLLDAINGFTPSGAYITDEAHALAMTVRASTSSTPCTSSASRWRRASASGGCATRWPS